jgi:ectoine hydroxylase-related dioxygenase (phytanoyl-CoA dioxygenase family)
MRSTSFSRLTSPHHTTLQLEEYVDTVEHTAVGESAALLMGSEVARFHHDHLLVKEPSTVQPTPWHQDMPYCESPEGHLPDTEGRDWPCTIHPD